MTALALPRLFNITLPWRAARPAAPTTPAAEDDLRREYLSRVIASDCCVGEYGVQGLMGLFPKDF